MRNLPLICLILLSVLAGCSKNSQITDMINRAEISLTDHPDSALRLLGATSLKHIRKSCSKARYALLYSQALDKNGIDTNRDTLIRTAVDYYEKHGDSLQKAKAYYYLARVLQNGGNYDNALEALSKAEDFVRNTDDKYLKGLLYQCKGSIYDEHKDYPKALSLFLNAIAHFASIGHERNEMVAYGKAAAIYAHLQNYNQALDYALHAKESAEMLADTGSIIAYATRIAHIRQLRKEPQEALDILRHTCAQYCNDTLPSSFYPLMSSIYLSENDSGNARKYALQFLQINKTAAAYALLGCVEHHAGNYKKSNACYLRSINLSDSLTAAQKQQAIREINQNYRDDEIQRELLHEKERNSARLIIHMLLFLNMAAILIILLLQRQKSVSGKDKRIKKYETTTGEVRDHCETLNSTPQSHLNKNTHSQEIIERQLSLLKSLLNLAGTQPGFSAAVYDKFEIANKKSKVSNKDIVLIFRSAFDLKYPGVIDYLKNKYPAVTEEDFDWYCLICLGCSASALAFIYNTSSSYVYNKRMMIRSKLGFCDENQSFNDYLQEISGQFE